MKRELEHGKAPTKKASEQRRLQKDCCKKTATKKATVKKRRAPKASRKWRRKDSVKKTASKKTAVKNTRKNDCQKDRRQDRREKIARTAPRKAPVKKPPSRSRAQSASRNQGGSLAPRRRFEVAITRPSEKRTETAGGRPLRCRSAREVGVTLSARPFAPQASMNGANCDGDARRPCFRRLPQRRLFDQLASTKARPYLVMKRRRGPARLILSLSFGRF